jgi:DNA-binding GntR family transcriptional regulator
MAASLSPLPSPVVVRFQATSASLPKHARLREAVVGAVEAGELALGTKMAGERELSAALGLSLGTTQKALGRLMDEGFLVRRQGHGTFVGSIRQPIAGSWHFRFVPPEGGAELPVFATIVERSIVEDEGPWSEVLGADPKGHVLVRRSLDIGGKFNCCSDLYLPATRFGRLLRMATKRLTDSNLKAVLAADFAAPTLQSDGVAHVAAIEAHDAALVGVRAGAVGLQVTIIGRSFGRMPITWQRMVVPPTRYGLKLDFNPPGADNAAT